MITILSLPLLSLISLHSPISLTLQFDGSLRPPKDPIPGFSSTSSTTSSSLSSGSGKFSSCSAAIFYSGNGGPIAIGGKYLPIEPGMTSADVEYDGLLLGLDWLLQSFSSDSSDSSCLSDSNAMTTLWDRDLSYSFNNDNDVESGECGEYAECCKCCECGEYCESDSTLLIRGDCKAVIDQLNSRSIPRKTETKYRWVWEKIHSLQELYADHRCHQRHKCHQCARHHGGDGGPNQPNPPHSTNGSRQPSNSPKSPTPPKPPTPLKRIKPTLSVRFEHTLRENNSLCDAICKLVTNQKQLRLVTSIQQTIELGRLSGSDEKHPSLDHEALDGNEAAHKKLSKRSKRSTTSNPNAHFQKASDWICSSTRLCRSSQIALACELTNGAIEQKDVTTLKKMSDFFLEMSRRWSRYYHGNGSSLVSTSIGTSVDHSPLFSPDNHSSTRTKHTKRKSYWKQDLKRISILTEFLSLHFNGFAKKANDLAKKHRIEVDCVEEGIQIMQEELNVLLCVCTGIPSLDQDCDFESMSDFVLSPYLDISDTVDGFEDECLKQALIGWNQLVSWREEYFDDDGVMQTRGVWLHMSSLH